jgi:adenine phosphoribosyltransferase
LGASAEPELSRRLRRAIRNIPDFPEPGILFRDIMPVLGDPGLFSDVVAALRELARERTINKVAGIESRGFILAAPLAISIGAGFVAVRKPGKLPGPTRRLEYALEYGKDALEIQEDAIRPGDRVYLVDDVLATGGTASAAARLIANSGGEVELAAFMVELTPLGGRERLGGLDMTSFLRY